MSTFEAAFDSLLQGVSQQVPRMRLPGQVSASINSLHDPVTGWRRRPGAQMVFALDMPNATSNSIKAVETDLGGRRVQVIIDTVSGTLKVLDEAYNTLETFKTPYLIAASVSHIQMATVRDEMFIVNTEKLPQYVYNTSSSIPPTRRGFAYVVAGNYSKTYDVTVTTNHGTVKGTYTTPSSSASNAVANSLPEYIASQLKVSLDAANMNSITGATVTVSGPYLYFECEATTTTCVISSASGTVFMLTSNASVVRQESQLPAILPAQANGYVVGVGTANLLVYYQYDAAKVRWLETGDWNSPTSITGMPISLLFDTTLNAWMLDSTDFEGRYAGDDDTNELPKIDKNGITGLASYQGRLVILSGSTVGLSSSKNPRRLLRSSVTSILDDDPIWVNSSANSSASYQYAVPFQKDLILFSSKYQALIPGSNVAITPRTATILITSSFSGDMSSAPLAVGRTLLYPTPLSSDFFGILEMISSEYSDSQYVSSHATEHLPKYMAGKCRSSASSSVSGTVLFGQSNDLAGLILYQYMWSGSDKVQQAWSRWAFGYEVATQYFQGEAVVLLFVKNGKVLGCKIDPKVGMVDSEVNRRPFLDLYVTVQVVNRQFTIPAGLLQFDPAIVSKLKLSQATGPMAGEEVGIDSIVGNTGTTVRSFTDGTCMLGIPFTTLLEPSPPMLLDQQGRKIDTAKMTVLRYGLTTQNSAEFKVAVYDSSQTPDPQAMGTLYWSSLELDLGQARVAEQSRAIIPARTNADTTHLQIYTDGLGELNIIGIDYACRYHQKLKRG